MGKAEDAGGDEAGTGQRQHHMDEGVPGLARRVAATSSGRSPMAAKAFCSGCTTKGMEYTVEPITRPVKLNTTVPRPNAWVAWPSQPCGPRAISK